MSGKISVFHPRDVISALTANSADAINWTLKKDQKVANVKYMHVDINAREVGGVKGSRKKSSAILSINEKDAPIVLTKTTINPADDKDFRVRAGYGPTIDTTVNNSGHFGKCLDLEDKEWHRQMNLLITNKQLSGAGGKGFIRPMVNRNYSDDCPKEELKGTARADPAISLVLDFGKFPATYPKAILRNQPITQVYDFTKSFVVKGREIKDKEGKVIGHQEKTEYELATVFNEVSGAEELLDLTNAHKFLRAGAKIRAGRFFQDSANQSAQGISCKTVCTRIVVEPAPEDGFGDEAADDAEDDGSEPLLTTLPTAVVVNVVTPVPTELTEPTEATDDDVNAFMDSM